MYGFVRFCTVSPFFLFVVYSSVYGFVRFCTVFVRAYFFPGTSDFRNKSGLKNQTTPKKKGNRTNPYENRTKPYKTVHRILNDQRGKRGNRTKPYTNLYICVRKNRTNTYKLVIRPPYKHHWFRVTDIYIYIYIYS